MSMPDLPAPDVPSQDARRRPMSRLRAAVRRTGARGVVFGYGSCAGCDLTAAHALAGLDASKSTDHAPVDRERGEE